MHHTSCKTYRIHISSTRDRHAMRNARTIHDIEISSVVSPTADINFDHVLVAAEHIHWLSTGSFWNLTRQLHRSTPELISGLKTPLAYAVGEEYNTYMTNTIYIHYTPHCPFVTYIAFTLHTVHAWDTLHTAYIAWVCIGCIISSISCGEDTLHALFHYMHSLHIYSACTTLRHMPNHAKPQRKRAQHTTKLHYIVYDLNSLTLFC